MPLINSLKRGSAITVNWLAILVVTFLYCLFLFVFPYAFNFKTDSNGHYLVVAVTTTGFLLIALFHRPATVLQIGAVLLAIAISLGYLYGSNDAVGNEYLAFCYALGIVTWLLLTLDSAAIHWPARIFAVLFLYEIVLAGTGAFQNSGIFAIYLVVNLPFCWFLLFNGALGNPGVRGNAGVGGNPAVRGKVWRWVRGGIFFGLALFCLGIVLIVRSRTALVAFVAMGVAILVWEYGDRWVSYVRAMPLFWRVMALSLVGFAGGGIGYYLFEVKKMSAYGRMLMIDIAWRHRADALLFGTGLGRFTWYYPMWQADYFKHTVNPPMAFYLSAGESYLIFNEFIQLFETIGILGFLVFVLLLFWFFQSRSSRHAQLLGAAKITLLGILVSGLTSYPLHVNGILVLASYCFVVAAVVGERKVRGTVLTRLLGRRWARVSLFLLLTVTAGFTALRCVKRYWAVREWQYIRDRSFADREGVKGKYRELYESLKGDGKFLTEYGEYLSMAPGDCPLAVEVLEDAKARFISRKTVELTGYAYKQINNYPKAIENFEWVSDYLPSNFSSRLELLKLYRLSGDSVKARRMGSQILTMPVKFPGQEVERIRRETRELLKEFN